MRLLNGDLRPVFQLGLMHLTVIDAAPITE